MSMLATATAWDLVADGYSEVSVEFFRGFNDAALELIAPGRDARILDVACGPGTMALAAADRVAAIDALDFSENMIAILRRQVTEQGLANVIPVQGDGQDLPYEDASFDAAFSMFGLMFFPDRARGYGEIHRTLKPGGRVCIASWAPVSRSPINLTMFGALRAINPDIPEPKYNTESLENPDLLARELRDAGFKDVQVHGVTFGIDFTSASDYWARMTRGSAPIQMMRKKMGEDAWAEKTEIALDHVSNSIDAFPAHLSADAWLGVGTR